MTQPDAEPMTAAELDRAIIGAARELAMANRARDLPRIEAARGALDALVAMRDAL